MRILLPWLAWLLLGATAAAEIRVLAPPPPETMARLLADESGRLTALARKLLGDEGGNSLFFVPTRDRPLDPADFGYRYEDVEFPTSDGLSLHGWFFSAPAGPREAKGTLVFSHGNTGSLGHHFGFVAWLIGEGYNLFMYDYRGFGESEGSPSRQGIVDDVSAAFRYVVSRPDVDDTKLVSIGHSLGAAASLTALGREKPSGLRGVVALAPFSSYRAIATRLAGNVGTRLVTDELSPKDYVARLAPVPVWIVHGTADELIPVEHGEALHALAGEPKDLLRVPGAGHVDLVSPDRPEVREKLLGWLEALPGLR